MTFDSNMILYMEICNIQSGGSVGSTVVVGGTVVKVGTVVGEVGVDDGT